MARTGDIDPPPEARERPGRRDPAVPAVPPVSQASPAPAAQAESCGDSASRCTRTSIAGGGHGVDVNEEEDRMPASRSG